MATEVSKNLSKLKNVRKWLLKKNDENQFIRVRPLSSNNGKKKYHYIMGGGLNIISLGQNNLK